MYTKKKINENDENLKFKQIISKIDFENLDCLNIDNDSIIDFLDSNQSEKKYTILNSKFSIYKVDTNNWFIFEILKNDQIDNRHINERIISFILLFENQFEFADKIFKYNSSVNSNVVYLCFVKKL